MINGICMLWRDVEEIAEALEELHSEEEVEALSLRTIKEWTIELLDFEDDPGKSNETILENIKEAWLELHPSDDEDAP